MTRKMYKTETGSKIIVNTETDTELYRTVPSQAPCSMHEKFFRVMLHETSKGKYLYLREEVYGPDNIEFSDTLWRAESVIRIIQKEMSDPCSGEKNWPSAEEIEKLSALGIDVFSGVET